MDNLKASLITQENRHVGKTYIIDTNGNHMEESGNNVSLAALDLDIVKKRALRCNPEKISKVIREKLSDGKNTAKVCLVQIIALKDKLAF